MRLSFRSSSYPASPPAPTRCVRPFSQRTSTICTREGTGDMAVRSPRPHSSSRLPPLAILNIRRSDYADNFQRTDNGCTPGSFARKRFFQHGFLRYCIKNRKYG